MDVTKGLVTNQWLRLKAGFSVRQTSWGCCPQIKSRIEGLGIFSRKKRRHRLLAMVAQFNFPNAVFMEKPEDLGGCPVMNRRLKRKAVKMISMYRFHKRIGARYRG